MSTSMKYEICEKGSPESIPVFLLTAEELRTLMAIKEQLLWFREKIDGVLESATQKPAFLKPYVAPKIEEEKKKEQ